MFQSIKCDRCNGQGWYPGKDPGDSRDTCSKCLGAKQLSSARQMELVLERQKYEIAEKEKQVKKQHVDERQEQIEKLVTKIGILRYKKRMAEEALKAIEDQISLVENECRPLHGCQSNTRCPVCGNYTPAGRD
jgi:rubrerythrin